MAFQEIAGFPLFYTRPSRQTSRSSSPPNLVLLHGAGGSHLDWPAALRRLSDTAVSTAVYTLDLPAHGRSEGPPLTSIEAFADRVGAWLDALELARVVLAGHSMGGLIALCLALRRHPALAGLVLIGSGARLKVSDLILDSAQTRPEITADFVRQYAWGPNAPAALSGRGRARLLETDPAVLYSDFKATSAFDVRDRLGEIALPTLVISGSADRMVPPKLGRFVAEQIPDATYVELEGIGHYAPLEAPAAVATAVAAFIAERIP